MRPTFLLLSIAIAPTLRSQVLLTDSLIQILTIGDLVAEGIPSPEYSVSVYKLQYATVDAFGAPTIASGALVVPNGPCLFPLFSYDHGTILNRNDVPSRESGELLVGKYMSAAGFVCALPDYIGLGDSPGMHPYIHAASEATATIDMMRAAREFCTANSVQLSEQVFLTGYSQGGHACMATHKMIQEEFPDEFDITASAPCSGPYDASGVQAGVIVADQPYPAPYYLPYILFAYQSVYADLFSDPSDILVAPYDTLLPPLFDGTHGAGDVDAVMPAIPNQILQPAMLTAFNTDPDHPFRQALRDNDLYDWAPQAPVRMNYCEGDQHVLFMNSIVARDTMIANGAPDISTNNMGTNTDHQACAFPALLNARNWFITLKEPCEGIGIAEVSSNAWSVAGGLTTDHWSLRSSSPADCEWILHDVMGRTVSTGSSFGSTSVLIPNAGLATGRYQLAVADGTGARMNFSLVAAR